MDASALAVFDHHMTADQTILVATAMRNEGPFIVEWVCWYRMLGFEILVTTNDCTDHSTQLLDALAEAGWLKHVQHQPHADEPPKLSAYRAWKREPLFKSADWVLTCDVDEFLVLHKHNTIAEFLGPPPHDFRAIAFSWKCFGTGNREIYQDGWVHRQFQRCGLGHLRINRSFKSIVRSPTDFTRPGAHFPHNLKTGAWTEPANRVLQPNGTVLPQFQDAGSHPIRFLEHDQISHDVAQMNHYITRTPDSYALKKGQPCASALHDRYTDKFFEKHNRNGMVDQSAQRSALVFKELHNAAMQTPNVKRLHHLCCADYVRALNKNAGTDAAIDDRLLHHLDKAGL